MADYNKVGLLAMRNGCMLLCRKRHTTSLLILPGGCLEPGESALECLNRELREELGDVQATDLEHIGTYTDRAAGEPTKTVQIELYAGTLEGEPQPRSEIRELLWFGENDNFELLAPSIRRKILPDLIARRILPWNNPHSRSVSSASSP